MIVSKYYIIIRSICTAVMWLLNNIIINIIIMADYVDKPLS